MNEASTSFFARSRPGSISRFVCLGLCLLSSSAWGLIKFDEGHDEIFVTAGLGLGYDSNIFANSTGGGDTIISANLDIEYKRKAGMIGVDSTLGWSLSKFDRYTSEDFANPHFNASFTKDRGRTTGSLAVDVARENRADTEINVRTTSWNYDSTLQFKYPVNERYSVSGALGYHLRDYLDNIALVDIRTYTASTDLAYAYSSIRDILAGYRFRATETTGRSESFDHSFTVGTSGKLWSKLTGSARVGYQVRQSVGRDRSDRDYGALTASVSTTWTLSRRFKLTGLVTRDFSTLATDTSVDNTSANLDAQFAAKTKFSLFGGIGGGYSRFIGLRGGGRRDTYFSYNAGANYTMNDRLKASLTYLDTKNWSTLPISDYHRQVINLSLTSRW
jgi:hypothetical protein